MASEQIRLYFRFEKEYEFYLAISSLRLISFIANLGIEDKLYFSPKKF